MKSVNFYKAKNARKKRNRIKKQTYWDKIKSLFRKGGNK